MWTKHSHIKVVSRNEHVLAALEMNRCGQGWLTCEHKCTHNGHRTLPSSFLRSCYCFIGYSLLTWAQHKYVRILLCCLQRVMLCSIVFYHLFSLSYAQTVQQSAPSLETLVSHVTHTFSQFYIVFSQGPINHPWLLFLVKFQVDHVWKRCSQIRTINFFPYKWPWPTFIFNNSHYLLAWRLPQLAYCPNVFDFDAAVLLEGIMPISTCSY